MVRGRRRVSEVDGAASEAALRYAADPLGFGDHLLWSERPRRLLSTNRPSRVEERESCLVGCRRGPGHVK